MTSGEQVSKHNIFPLQRSADTGSLIFVVGVGGAGRAMSARLRASGLPLGSGPFPTALRYIDIDAAPALAGSDADLLLPLGRRDDGHYSPDTARVQLWQQRKALRTLLGPGDMAVILTGLGGAIGSGAAPVAAKIARDTGLPSVVLATMPALSEARRGPDVATAIRRTRSCADALVLLSHQIIAEGADGPSDLASVFAIADRRVCQTVAAFAGCLENQLMGFDFEDLRTVLGIPRRPRSVIGHVSHGTASGNGRAEIAARRAWFTHPCSDRLHRAYSVFTAVAINLDRDFRLAELDAIMRFVDSRVGKATHSLVGTFRDHGLPAGHLRVSLIVFEREEP